MSSLSFDVAVVGAGHAGAEAARAAALLGCHVALVTLSRDTAGHMPCNPAIGGTAKGHLVREIDALGGLMGEAIDATGIQFKLLNRSRGPAVWSPRAQADKHVYSLWVADKLVTTPNIKVVEARAGRILIEGARVIGLELEDGERLACGALVITTGTFLNGLIHVGRERRPAGRHGEPPSRTLAESIRDLGFTMGRLKTGTPPRLHRRSIDFAACVERGLFSEEKGDASPVPFSFESSAPLENRASCWLLHTTDRVHGLVREHVGESPLYISSNFHAGQNVENAPSVLETDDQRTKFRQRKPQRHLPLEHAAFAVGIRPGRSLAGDHEHNARFVGLGPLQEAQQRGVGSALRHAMQINPAIDRLAAARHPLAQSPA